MRFLFHFYDLQQRAGIQRAMCELANALVETGHEVTIASTTPSERVVFHLDPRVHLLITPHAEYKKSGVSAWLIKAAWAFRQAIVIRKFARQTRPDLIVDHGTAFGLLYPFGTISGVPFVLQRHFPARSFPHGQLLYGLLRLISFSKVIVVLTEGIAHEMRSFGFRHIAVISNVIPSGAQPAPWPDSEPRMGLLLGRAVPQKGFDLFLEALSMNQPSGWHFVIAGPGVESSPLLHELINRHRLDGYVSLLPSTDDPYTLIRQSSLLIMPSRYEALPMVALEALSMARPVLASDAEGLREIVIPWKNGAVFPVGDVATLSTTLSQLCGDPGALLQLAAGSPSSVAHYDRNQIVRAWTKLAASLAVASI